MNSNIRNKIFVLSLILILLLLFSSAAFAQGSTPRLIYYYNASGELVRADYREAVTQVLDNDDPSLLNAIRAKIIEARLNGRSIFVQDMDGNVVNYGRALDHGKLYSQIIGDPNYALPPVNPVRELVIVDPNTGAYEERLLGRENQSFVRVFYNGTDYKDVYEGDILYLIHGQTTREMQLMFHNRTLNDVIAENFVVDLMENNVRERVWEMRPTVLSRTLAVGITRILDNLQDEYDFAAVRVNDEDLLELRVDETVSTVPEWVDIINTVFGAAALIDDNGDNVWETYVSLQDAIDAAGENYTVTLYDDVAENITIEHEGLTLDLNGNDIDGNVSANGDFITVMGVGSIITGDLHVRGENVTVENGVTIEGNVHFYSRAANLTYSGTRGAGSVYHYDLERVRVETPQDLFNALFNDQAGIIMLDEDITVDFDLHLYYPNILIDLNSYTLSSNPGAVILIDAAEAEISGGTLNGFHIKVRDGLQDPLIDEVTFSGNNVITLGMNWVSREKTTLYFGTTEVVGTLTLNALNPYPFSVHDDYGFIGKEQNTVIHGTGLVELSEDIKSDSPFPPQPRGVDFHHLTFVGVDVDIYNSVRFGEVTFEEDVDLTFMPDNFDPNAPILVTILNEREVTFNNIVDDINANVIFNARIDAGAFPAQLAGRPYHGTLTGEGKFIIVPQGDVGTPDIPVLELQGRTRIRNFEISGDDVYLTSGPVYFEEIPAGHFSNKVFIGDPTLNNSLVAATMHMLDNFPLQTASNEIVLVTPNATLDGNGNTAYGTSGAVRIWNGAAGPNDYPTIRDLTIATVDADLLVDDHVNLAGTVNTGDVIVDNGSIINTIGEWNLNRNVVAVNNTDATFTGGGTINGNNNSIVVTGTGVIKVNGSDLAINQLRFSGPVIIGADPADSTTFTGCIFEDLVFIQFGDAYFNTTFQANVAINTTGRVEFNNITIAAGVVILINETDANVIFGEVIAGGASTVRWNEDNSIRLRGNIKGPLEFFNNGQDATIIIQGDQALTFEDVIINSVGGSLRFDVFTDSNFVSGTIRGNTPIDGLNIYNDVILTFDRIADEAVGAPTAMLFRESRQSTLDRLIVIIDDLQTSSGASLVVTDSINSHTYTGADW